ncbi:hypothetical protein B0T17DRAFT_381015 [Bombardia bombarda]|uniref:Uncharacterized protein n=1 Tax=Bombardia bombarda TaxID=252184 RepID=A0AA40BVJ3_9PEZI|nr:hypothetical protein B0T17DRAFT_381015 [Bombardia bombarda]
MKGIVGSDLTAHHHISQRDVDEMITVRISANRPSHRIAISNLDPGLHWLGACCQRTDPSSPRLARHACGETFAGPPLVCLKQSMEILKHCQHGRLECRTPSPTESLQAASTTHMASVLGMLSLVR